MADIALLAELNRDIWHPFRSSYAAGDADAFLRLYTRDLIRAGGPAGEVYGWSQYAAETTEWFGKRRERGDTVTIDFRFFERIAADEKASERGHYRIDAPSDRVFFGRFHTFARKDDGVWRIAVDYDSNEGGSIDAATFEAGAPIDDTARFA